MIDGYLFSVPLNDWNLYNDDLRIVIFLLILGATITLVIIPIHIIIIVAIIVDIGGSTTSREVLPI